MHVFQTYEKISYMHSFIQRLYSTYLLICILFLLRDATP